MAEQADVRSLEQLEEFSDFTKRFRAQLLQEIEQLRVEFRKLTEWLEHEALDYWQAELVRSQRRLSEAQEALTRCMSYVRENERKPCSEEKKRVKRERDRRELCEEKLKTARAAAAYWEREMTKCRGKLQRCFELGDAELMVALQHLDGQIERLRDYAQLKFGAQAARAMRPKREQTQSTNARTDETALDPEQPD